jgi:WD40 repeat protein
LHSLPEGVWLVRNAQDRWCLWDVPTGAVIPWQPRWKNARSMTIQRDSALVWTAHWDGEKWVIERSDPGVPPFFGEVSLGATPARPGGTPVFSPDARLVLLRRDDTYWFDVFVTRLGQAHARTNSPGGRWFATCFSPDGKLIAALGREGRLAVFDSSTGVSLHHTTHKGQSFSSLTFSPDGRVLAVAGQRDLFIWDVKTGQLTHRLQRLAGPVAFSHDGRYLASAAGDAVHLLDATRFRPVRTFARHDGRPGVGLAFGPDSRLLALANGEVSVWDVTTGKQVPSPFPGHGAAVCALAFSPDGRRLVSGGLDGQARVWRLDTGQTEHALDGHSGRVVGVALSPTGTLLASGDGEPGPDEDLQEAATRLWDLPSGRLVRKWDGHLGPIRHLLFSPKGDTLASSGGDTRVRLWDVKTGARLAQLRGVAGLRPVAFTDDGKQLVARGADAARSRWSVPGGRLLAGGTRDVKGGAGGIAQEGKPIVSAITPDGATVACVEAESNQVIELRAPDGTVLHRLAGHGGAVLALAVSADGRWLASGSEDTTVLLWDLDRLRLSFICRQLFRPPPLNAVARLDQPGRTLDRITQRFRQLAQSGREARRLIASLDSDDYPTREKAERALLEIEDDTEDTLRAAATEKRSPEAHRRLARVLARLSPHRRQTPPDPALLRQAVRQLALLSHPAARRALEALAREDPASHLTQEARRALDRLGGKPAGPIARTGEP